MAFWWLFVDMQGRGPVERQRKLTRMRLESIVFEAGSMEVPFEVADAEEVEEQIDGAVLD